MENWVAEWLAEERRKGKKCLEIKYVQGKPYVYYSTSTYNRETKKVKKISRYIGRLTQDKGILTKGSNRPSQDKSLQPNTLTRPKSVFEYGNAKLLGDSFIEMVPILKPKLFSYLGNNKILTASYAP